MSTAAVFDRMTRQMEGPVTSAQLSGIVPLSDATPRFVDAVRAISTLMRLPDNWDSYGSPRIRQAAAQRAVEVLIAAEAQDPPPPRIVPVSGGGLQIEWGAGVRELEVEMLPDGSIEFLKVEGNQMSEARLPAERIYLDVPMLLQWLSREEAHAAAIR